MGLSNLPAPSEGILCALLVNTALSITILKGMIRSIVRIVGIGRETSSDHVEVPLASLDVCLGNADGYIDEFRSRMPSVRFDDVCRRSKRTEPDCSVCLTRFDPESEINLLSCGHVFHKVCLEKWLKYWNVTCPLCRTALLPEDDPSCYL